MSIQWNPCEDIWVRVALYVTTACVAYLAGWTAGRKSGRAE